MNPQAIFDRVVDHLRKQGRKATRVERVAGVEGECAYRSDDGAMCAVGCLLTEEAYSPDLEGKNTMDRKVLDALRASGINPSSELAEGEDATVADLLDALQECHDRFDVEDWEDRLERVAGIYDLTYTPAPESPR